MQFPVHLFLTKHPDQLGLVMELVLSGYLLKQSKRMTEVFVSSFLDLQLALVRMLLYLGEFLNLLSNCSVELLFLVSVYFVIFAPRLSP